MKLRCFVAMPFGRNETDEIYDKIYKKTLRELNITPVRIDKKQHNNDIDKEIISELKKCDFIISDLTFARPSVYFEAGFGVGYSASTTEMEKPVIYTCRNDHRTHKKEDEFGNYTVHFDLQMKNIIFWKNNKDHDFIKKLKNRIKYVITPLQKNHVENNKENQKTSAFSNLALQVKIQKIFNIGVDHLPKKGFHDIINKNEYEYYPRRDINNNINIRYPETGFPNNSLIPLWISSKVENNVRKTIYFHIVASLTKSQLDYLDFTLLSKPSYNIFPRHNGKKVKRFDEYVIIGCFNPTTPKNILNYLHTYSFDKKFETYNWKGTQLVPKKIPPEWKNLFQVRRSDYGKYGARLTYDRENDRKSETYTQTGNFLRYTPKGSHEQELIRLVAIPRTIKIKIIDSIKHADHFTIGLKDFLEHMNSNKI